MKIYQTNLIKVASILAVLSLGMVSTSSMAQRGERGDSRVDSRRDSRVDNRRDGNHNQFNQRAERQNRKALRAANQYLDALEKYYLWAEDCGLRGLAKHVKNLYDTVHDKIQKPLKRGKDFHRVQSKLRLVHQDVRKVWDVIDRKNLGRQATKKFRSIDEYEKINLVRALNNRARR